MVAQRSDELVVATFMIDNPFHNQMIKWGINPAKFTDGMDASIVLAYLNHIGDHHG